MVIMAALFEAPSPCNKNTALKLQAIFHDGSVGLEFMTDDPSEAEEMREQLLTLIQKAYLTPKKLNCTKLFEAPLGMT
jgi:hypothetical protein